MSVYRNDQPGAVQEAFESLMNQEGAHADLLVQLDGPVHPEVEHYLDALLASGKIVYLGKRARNYGLAYSLNELVQYALETDYELIFRMDSDDITARDRLQAQIAYMIEHPDVDLLGGWIEEFNTDTGERQVIRYAEKHSDILKFLRKRNPIAHVTVCIRRSFFEKVGIYNPESLNEDLELWIRGIEAGCHFHNLQKVLVQVRTNNAFFARRKNITRAFEVMRLKWHATHVLHLGKMGYIYAFAHFAVFMSPAWIKSFLYRHFRKP